MQLYVLDRAKNTLATTSSFYSDKHHKELTAGASIFEFTIDKSDSAAQYMTTGNYLVFKDDRGRAWSFTILSYDETQTTKTVAAEDVSIELLNKAMDVWNTDQAYPFSYYFNLVTKGTPWKLGVNQLTDLSRKLVYTGRDTGLGRLLSVLKGFDNAECQFNIRVQQNKPVEFVVDVYKSIGTVQDNIQIVYNNELADIKKTESRAQFVTALAGIGGLVENQATTDPGLEKHIDFMDIDYKDDNFVSPKGDKFLRAVTANRMFNPGTTTYIEDFYDYDTQSAQELLNRTLTQLKERSEPQYTYDADVKVIDPTLDIGDTVTMIDHDYNPALYLQARVATLDKSYTDPTQGAITFCNYRLLNSNLSDQLRAMQNIIDQLPTSASIKVINNNIVQMITDNAELKKQVALSFESANGKSRVWFSRSSTAQDGDIAFIKNADGATEIWKFVEGAWKLDTGLATFEDVKKAASAAADAGSQAVIAGQQASAAGADAKSAGDFAASAASQSAIETAAARSTANSAADAASDAVTAAFGAGTTADQAKSAAAAAKADAASAKGQATNALGQASTAIANAATAINAATDAQTKTNSLVTKVDDIAGTIKTLATTETVDQLAGTVATTQSLAQFAADGLKLKADTTTVNQINGTVNDLKGELDVQADKIAATVTASDVTGMLNGYATQSWSQGQISAAKNEISASVETVKQTVDNWQVGVQNLIPFSEGTAEDATHWQGSSTVIGTVIESGPVFILDGDATTNGSHRKFASLQKDLRPKLAAATKYYVSFEYKVEADSLPVNLATIFTIRTTLEDGGFTDNGLSLPDKLNTGQWYKSAGFITTPANMIDTILVSVILGFNGRILFRRLLFAETNTPINWLRALSDYATTDWTKSLLDVSEGKVSAQVQSVKTDLTNTLNNNIANATAGMATQTWTQGKLDLTADSLTSQISSIQNGLNEKYTSLEQTLSGVQATANDAVTQSQYTQLADQFTSTIAAVASGNLVADSGWTGAVAKTHTYYSGPNILYGLANATTGENYAMSPRFSLKPNTTYTLTMIGFAESNVVNADVFVLARPKGSTKDYEHIYNLLPNKRFSPDAAERATSSFKTLNDSEAYIRIDNNGTNNGVAGTVYFTEVQLEEGSIATPYKLSVSAAQSQITQLQSDINLRVKTGDLVSQIDVNAKRILLDGASTYITNTTHIDTGVIKTAMIADAAITNGKIANAAIDNAKIANASITAAKIADLAVGSAQIADGAISSAKIGNAAITSAKIADASIIDAKIVNLDGSKIVANSITADKLNVNAITVGLNQYGVGWQIKPASISFLPPGTTKASLVIDGTGITFSDILNGETLAMMQGTPYNIAKDTWYNGMLLDLSPNNDYVAMVDESAAAKTKFAWSRSDKTDFGMFAGFNFYDHVHFNTIGPFDPDAKSRLRCVRIEIGGRWATGFMNLGTVKDDAGIAFTDDGATFICRASKWYNLFDIVNKIGIA